MKKQIDIYNKKDHQLKNMKKDIRLKNKNQNNVRLILLMKIINIKDIILINMQMIIKQDIMKLINNLFKLRNFIKLLNVILINNQIKFGENQLL